MEGVAARVNVMQSEVKITTGIGEHTMVTCPVFFFINWINFIFFKLDILKKKFEETFFYFENFEIFLNF